MTSGTRYAAGWRGKKYIWVLLTCLIKKFNYELNDIFK